jgi:hypothetical protein
MQREHAWSIRVITGRQASSWHPRNYRRVPSYVVRTTLLERFVSVTASSIFSLRETNSVLPEEARP